MLTQKKKTGSQKWNRPFVKKNILQTLLHQGHKINTAHLQNLEGSWNHMTTRMPLCVRVVLKSKDRMIVRQEDARKPIILLTTLLVADSTGKDKLYLVFASGIRGITLWLQIISVDQLQGRSLYPRINGKVIRSAYSKTDFGLNFNLSAILKTYHF